MFAAPATLAPGTVVDLEGRENHVDHLDLWLTLPPAHGLVYAIGDLLCHQKHWRTLTVNGNGMPVDERMTAIFLAGIVGLAVGLRASPSPFVTQAMRGALPRALARRVPVDPRRAARVLALAVVVALLPAAVDVWWENLLGRESTRALRLATGTLAGVAGGLVLAGFAVAVDQVARTVWTTRVAPRFPRLHRAVGGIVTGERARPRDA